MFSVNPKWYRVYNATSEYFVLAESQPHALRAVCDHVNSGAEFNVEYAAMSAVCSNVDEIVGEFDAEEMLNELYYQENIHGCWYLVSYELRGNIYTDYVLVDCENSAYQYFVERINQHGNYVLVDIHAATKKEVIDDMYKNEVLEQIDDLEYTMFLDDSHFEV